MFIIGNFLSATAQILKIVLELYMWIMIIRALLSWVNPDPHNPIVQFLMSGVGIDFSPMIVILIIIFLQSFLVNSIGMIAMRLQ